MSWMTARLCALTRSTPGLPQTYSWQGTSPLGDSDMGRGPLDRVACTRQFPSAPSDQNGCSGAVGGGCPRPHSQME